MQSASGNVNKRIVYYVPAGLASTSTINAVGHHSTLTVGFILAPLSTYTLLIVSSTTPGPGHIVSHLNYCCGLSTRLSAFALPPIPQSTVNTVVLGTL